MTCLAILVLILIAIGDILAVGLAGKPQRMRPQRDDSNDG